LLRIWGATSAYGQSLGRLITASAVIVLCHAFALLGARHQLVGTHPHPGLLVSAFWEAALAFFGLSDITTVRYLADVIVVSLRVCGFLALGVWVSIAAVKVSRLGSE
jgi:hypothetical protein